MITAAAGTEQFQNQRTAMVQASYENRPATSTDRANEARRIVSGQPQNQDRFSSMFEGVSPRQAASFSVQAQLNATFEGSVQITGPNGKLMNAYVSMQADYSFSMEGRVNAAPAAEGTAVAGKGDSSPQSVADRIVDFAVGFFPMFAADNPDMTEQEQVTAFKEMVEGAIDEGFSQAMTMLGNPGGEVANTIQETRDLITKKLDSLFTYLLDSGNNADGATDTKGDVASRIAEFMNRDVTNDATAKLVTNK